MKIIRTNTSELALSWAADTTSPRALHRHLGEVLVAADFAKIPDDAVTVNTVGTRTTVSFTTTELDVPRKSAMSAWNPKALNDSGVEFTARQTTTLTYALHHAATAGDLMRAVAQVQDETNAARGSSDPDEISVSVIDGVTTLSVTASATVPGTDLAALLDSPLGALLASNTGLDADPEFVNPDSFDPVEAANGAQSAEVPAAPAKAVKKPAKAAPAAVTELVTQAPTEPGVAPAADVGQPTAGAPAGARDVEQVAEAPEKTAVIEVSPEPAAEASAPEPAIAAAAAPVLTVISGPTTDAQEPDDFDSYPPEEDAPEPVTPDAPDWPDFDVAALKEPPVESVARRPSSPPNSRPRTKSFAPAAAAAGTNGKRALTEDDVF